MSELESSKHFVARRWQIPIHDHIVGNPRCAVWADMGLGKTAGVLDALLTLNLTEDVFPVLIIAPLRVAKSTWPKEVRAWKEFEHLRIVAIPAKSARARAVNVRTRADIYTINHENIPWLAELWGADWPYKTVVVDESTKLKSFRTRGGGKRSKALGRVAFTKVKRFIELTGTPSPNGVIDLWGQAWFLDAGSRLGRSFTHFTDRWFFAGYDGYSKKPTESAQREIEGRLSDLCLSVRGKDYFNLEEPIVNNIYVELEPAARVKYREMEKEMFLELEQDGIKHGIEAVNAAVRTLHCLQIANGALYLGSGNREYVEIHDVKLKALEEIIEEAAGMPVLVAYHFNHDLERLLKAFPQGRFLDADPKTEDDWNAGRIPVLFAHPASAGHGLSLQHGGNILVYFAHNWDLEQRMQILERIGPTRQMQSGYDRPVYIHNIIAKDTMDEVVIARTDGKKSVQELLLEAMSRYENAFS